jgi:glycosyltransferase involved in cell wall biosynthesis
MRVLYLGANIRMRLASRAAPEIRALGLKQGLEQAGVEVIPLMAGDEVNAEGSRSLYSIWLKRFLPGAITHALRDGYEIALDRKLGQIMDRRARDIVPDVILQKHGRYLQAGVELGRRYGIPVFLDDIAPIWEGERYGDRSLKPIARYIRRQIFARASGLIAVSRDMETQLRAEGVPDQRIHFVPNGVDCTLFDPDAAPLDMRHKYGLADKIVVGYVGVFARWHGLDLLLRVASDITKVLPTVHFLMVGDDTDGEVEKMARQQGLADWFTFTGGVPHLEVPAYLTAMDIATLPSTLPYMSPIKLYEYMAMRKAVVAPNGNSITEDVIVPGQNGLLFEAGSAESLGSAIVSLATRPDLRYKLGVEARDVAHKRFTWDCQASALLKAFQAALARPVN